VDCKKAELAAKYLVENIEARDGLLSTGFIGTEDLMLALARTGRNPDTGIGAGGVAYRLIHNDTFPSWGFSIKHGATSIWERWNGWTPETGFGDPGMNSFAHYSFGAVYQWMVENIGGIRNDAHSSPHAPREVDSSHSSLHHAERDDYYLGAGGVAYKKIVIAPTPGGKLTSADVRYDSIRGRIESAWKKSGDKLTLHVTVPANTTATVLVPAKTADTITESPESFRGWRKPPA
jgi:alpha-L-rhamnosidase